MKMSEMPVLSCALLLLILHIDIALKSNPRIIDNNHYDFAASWKQIENELFLSV